jgi:hypothetical protein
MKRFFALIVALSIFAGAGIATEIGGYAVAAPLDDPYYEVSIVTTIDSVNTYDSLNTYTVTFRVTAKNGAVFDGWEYHLAYDTSVFDLLTIDGSHTLTEVLRNENATMTPGADYTVISTGFPDYNFMQVSPVPIAPTIKTAISLNNRTAYISTSGGFLSGIGFMECTIRFVFNPKRTVVDATTDSIRFMHRSEMRPAFGETSAISLRDGTDIHRYRKISGESDDFPRPIFELDETWAESVIVKSTTHPEGPFINLTEETIHIGNINVVAYSVNAGRSWRRGSVPTGTAFTRFFNRDMTLFIATELDLKRKPIGTFIEFPLIKQRTRIRVGSHGRSATINSTGKTFNHTWVPEGIGLWYGEETWNFTKRNSPVPAENTYIFAKSSNGLTPDAGESWRTVRNGMAEVMIEQPGVNIQYIYRLPPVGDGSAENPYTAASRVVRVRPRALSRAPSYRIDFRSNSIRMRSGDVFTIGDGSVQQFSGTPLFLTEIPVGTVITIWRAPTGRRPPSAKQEIIVPM